MRTCPKCQIEFESEAVLFEGREMFSTVPALCGKCAEQCDRERRERESRFIEAEWARKWEKICPVRFRDTESAKLPDAAAMEAVLSWVYGRDGLLCHGPTGKGKTRCLYLLLHRLHFKQHRSIIALGAADFGLQCGRLFWVDQDGAAAYIQSLIRAEILMIDDLDKARFSERVEAELFHVIDARTANGRPILASLNSTGDELAAMMTEQRGFPIVRRLRDYCRQVLFE